MFSVRYLVVMKSFQTHIASDVKRHLSRLRSRKGSLLTSGLNSKLGLFALLAGHREPAPIWVLNPLGGLAVEQPLVHGLQLVDRQPVGRGAGFIQPEVPGCHPLPIRSSRAQNEVPRQGDQLLRRSCRILRNPQIPTNR